MQTQHPRDAELIATVLDGEQPSPTLQRWLATEAGRRELETYQEALNMLKDVYGSVRVSQPAGSVYYAAVRTPVGRVFVAATEAGLARISFRMNETAFVTELRKLKRNVVKSVEKVSGVAAQLEAYFAGKRRAFDVPLDLLGMQPFQRSVLMAASNIPAGQVVSYHDIARRIGRPTASRAVGQALGHNPIPIVIPCHRVVSSSGGLGGYTGGLTIKKKLLKLEGAQV